MTDQNSQLQIEVEIIPALYLPDMATLEFRNPATTRGGRVCFTQVKNKLLVEFVDLDPNVEPIKAIADPVQAGHILDIVRYVIQWLENLRMHLPTQVDSAKPLAFDGLPTLRKLEKQLLLEVDENEPL